MTASAAHDQQTPPHVPITATAAPPSVTSDTAPTLARDTVPTKRIRIRSYRPDDHQGVIDVFVPGLLANAQLPGQSRQFWDEYIGSSLQDDLADIDGTYFARGGHYWVAVCERDDGTGDEIVGMVALERKSEGEGELRRMSVKAEYRRYGVGRLLMLALEDWAVQHGFTRVWLSAGYILEKAHRFYKSMGFTIFKDEVFYDEPLFILAFFEKQLQPATIQA